MRRFGLVGYPLGHSYSREFFRKKFKKLELKDHIYELFEMEYLKEFPALWLKHTDLVGVNVTVPHKENILRFLDYQDISLIKVGAANVVKKKQGKLVGYNTDLLSFRESLESWVGDFEGEALVLGSGGSSKAVRVGLDDLKIDSYQVSRQRSTGDYTYDQLKDQPEILDRFHLIVNTTPLGMYPDVDNAPDIPYERLTENHFLFDLIYNPEETMFLRKGKKHGAKVKNGLEMLKLQAEKSWDIWNDNGF